MRHSNHPWRHVWAAAAALLAVLGCAGERALIGSSDEPAIYLVLERAPQPAPDGAPPTDSGLRALVVTSAGPQSPSYREVESFALRRSRDGANFDWRIEPATGLVPTVNGSLDGPVVGNVVLPWTTTGTGLGRDSLLAGETYELRVVSEGRLIEGTATLPGVPQPQLQVTGMTQTIVWPRAALAAAYVLVADTEQLGAVLTTDTTYTLRRDRPASQRPPTLRATVIALDANVHAMVTDTTRHASGVRGARGIFGGVSRAAIELPPG